MISLKKIRTWRPITAYSADHHSESFLVSAIVTVLLTRFFLELTGYPQLGGSELHIAHVVWGGLLMGAAMLILVTFMGDRPKALASIIGGVGFGLFVDELGKYVTHDNDYFFKPTALLLYALFLSLWLLVRSIRVRRRLGQLAAQANTLELLQEGLLYGFNRYERAELKQQLSSLDGNVVMNKTLSELARQIQTHARRDDIGLYRRISQTTLTYYRQLVGRPLFRRILYSVFFVQVLLAIVSIANFVGDVSSSNRIDIEDALTRSNIGQLIGTILYGGFVSVGMWWLRTDRMRAYTFIRRGLLLNLFITQFFAFYRLQFVAVFSLLLNLALLGAIQYLMTLERQNSKK